MFICVLEGESMNDLLKMEGQSYSFKWHPRGHDISYNVGVYRKMTYLFERSRCRSVLGEIVQRLRTAWFSISCVGLVQIKLPMRLRIMIFCNSVYWIDWSCQRWYYYLCLLKGIIVLHPQDKSTLRTALPSQSLSSNNKESQILVIK